MNVLSNKINFNQISFRRDLLMLVLSEFVQFSSDVPTHRNGRVPRHVRRCDLSRTSNAERWTARNGISRRSVVVHFRSRLFEISASSGCNFGVAHMSSVSL